MTKDITSELELISKFLDPNLIEFEKLKSIKDTLDLPVKTFKFLDDMDVKLIQGLFDIFKIDDFTALDQENPFQILYDSETTKTNIKKILNDNPEFEEKVKKAVVISVLMKLIEKKSIPIEKKTQKVIVLGLENAGKTAIIKKIGSRLKIDDLTNLKPTKGIENQKIETKDFELTIWDFGGQENYRVEHLKQEMNFIKTNLLMYVIDVQDPEKLEDSFYYFNNIIELLIRLEEKPHFLILIHKYDPDIRDDPEVLLRVELIRDTINILMKDKPFEYEIYLSSIFSQISNEPEFSILIKDLLKDRDSFIYKTKTTKGEIKNLGQVIETNINALIKISDICSDLERRINFLESRTSIQGASEANISLLLPLYPPPPPLQESAISNTRGPGIRAAVIGELKELFARKIKLSIER